MTIAEAIAAAEEQRKAAERRQSDAIEAVKQLQARARSDGRAHLTEAEEVRCLELLTAKRKAGDDVARFTAQVDGLRQAATEEAEVDRQLATTTRTGGAAPSGDAVHRIGSGSRTADTRTGFVRLSDGRPAAVERSQRYAEHPVVAEYAAAQSIREQHVVGHHGGLGNMLRSMTTTSGSAVVPTLWSAEIIDRARNLSAVLRAGAQIVPMDALTLNIGRLTTDPTAAFRTEGSTVTASDPVFDQVQLVAKTMSCLVIGSMEWFADSPNVDEVVSNAIAQTVATQLDLVALFGQVTTGAEQTATGNNMLPTGGLPTPNPRGILATLLATASSSVLGAATNGTVQTAATFYGEVIDTIFTPRDFNESPNALLWPSKLARIYARAADSTNQPMRQPPDVEQIQKFVTNQIPSGFTQGTGTLMSDLFVGDFTQLIIGQRLDFTVQTLVERYAELGQVGILCHWRGDVALARPRAFAVHRFLKGM